MSTKTRPLYQWLAMAVRESKSEHVITRARGLDIIEHANRECLPSGSGLDAGSAVDPDRSNATQLVIATSFHHMNDAGMYDGWTDHRITLHANLHCGFNLTVSGRNRNGIKEYLAELFDEALSATYILEWHDDAETYTLVKL